MLDFYVATETDPISGEHELLEPKSRDQGLVVQGEESRNGGRSSGSLENIPDQGL